MIGSNGSNEKGTYTHTAGGQYGDQTGREFRVRDWYDFGQTVCLWYPDNKVNELVAWVYRFMCENDLHGYCQTHRISLWDAIVRAGYDIAKVNEQTESDCSSSTIAAIKLVGYMLGIDSLKDVNPDAYTGNLELVLTNAGYIASRDGKYLRSENNLLPGYILLKPGSHVVVELANEDKKPIAGLSTSECFNLLQNIPYMAIGETSDRVGVLQCMLNIGMDLDDNGFGLVVDKNFGSETEKVVRQFQHDVHIEEDGVAGLNTLSNLIWHIFEKANL